MPTVSFTQNLQRHLACDTATVGGATLAEALDEVFKNNPAMRGYILDDQGQVRKHVAIYLNNQTIADRAGVPLEISPKMIEIFDDGIARYGERELSPNIIRRLEDATGLTITAPGFPAEMTDDEPEEPGYEVIPRGR